LKPSQQRKEELLTLFAILIRLGESATFFLVFLTSDDGFSRHFDRIRVLIAQSSTVNFSGANLGV
jgi:hypothetical protein